LARAHPEREESGLWRGILHAMGGGYTTVGAWGLLLAVAACSSPQRRDLYHNDLIYRRTGYSVRLPVDRAAFIAPLRDDRSGAVPAAADARFHPLNEAAWDRPMRLMVEDVLRDELRDSGIVDEVLVRATPEALVIQPYLQRCVCGSTEEVSGGRSIAEVELRIQVYGPADEGGQRSLLLEETYSDRQASEIQLRPPQAPLLLGLSLRRTVAQMLEDLDTRNVSRAGVPQSQDAGSDPVPDPGR